MNGYASEAVGYFRAKPDDPKARAQAAEIAVSPIALNVIQAGGTPDQASVIQEAVRLGLLGDFSGAREKLTRGGFDQEVIDGIMSELESPGS